MKYKYIEISLNIPNIFRGFSNLIRNYLIMSIKNRFKDYIKSQKTTISSYEKVIKVSNGYINSISKGVGGEILLNILEKSPNLNIEWLLTGEGSMLKDETGSVNQNVTGSNVTMVGGSVSVKNSNNATTTDNNKTQTLKDELKALKIELKEKVQEIKRLKTQVDKLFKMIG